MANWWTEMWTSGSGRNRVYCGIARTEEGFAVDLFRGDSCEDSWIYPTRESAVRAALDLERLHGARMASAGLEVPAALCRHPRQRLTAH